MEGRKAYFKRWCETLQKAIEAAVQKAVRQQSEDPVKFVGRLLLGLGPDNSLDGGSTSAELPAQATAQANTTQSQDECLNAGKAQLAKLDERLLKTLKEESIMLLDADELRSCDVEKIRMKRRQDLPREYLLPGQEAARLFQLGERLIAVLTYGWRTPTDPDPDGYVLSMLVEFLNSKHGKPIKGVFWDYSSLFQLPRSKNEEKLFRAALEGMGDLYASGCGSMVVRCERIPPCPDELKAKIVVAPRDYSQPPAEEEIRTFLATDGRTLQHLEYIKTHQLWCATLGDEKEVKQAIEAIQKVKSFRCSPWYNDRDYSNRGWCCFESGISMECAARSSYYPGLREMFKSLPPKLIVIDDSASYWTGNDELDQAASEGAGPRVERVRQSISKAEFTGAGDDELVLRLYDDYINSISNAMHGTGDKVGALI